MGVSVLRRQQLNGTPDEGVRVLLMVLRLRHEQKKYHDKQSGRINCSALKS